MESIVNYVMSAERSSRGTMDRLNKSELELKLKTLLDTIANSQDKDTVNNAHGIYLVLNRQYELLTGHSYNFKTAKRRYRQ